MVAGTVYRAQMEFAHDSGLPRDRVTNVFHFATTQVAGIDFPNIRDMLVEFYDDPAGGASSIFDFVSEQLTRDYELNVYHLTDPLPRVPVASFTGVLTSASAAQALPSEVAFVTSWAAAPISGVPPARLRGRTYLGPLNIGALAAADGTPAAAFITTVVAASDRLASAADASVTWDMVVYSTTLPGGPGDGARANKVVSGWVDNAFDTQRRRGEGATARTTWVI